MRAAREALPDLPLVIPFAFTLLAATCRVGNPDFSSHSGHQQAPTRLAQRAFDGWIPTKECNQLESADDNPKLLDLHFQLQFPANTNHVLPINTCQLRALWRCFNDQLTRLQQESTLHFITNIRHVCREKKYRT